MKRNVMVRLNEELVRKAKEYGLNISKVSENALKEMIKRMEAPNDSKEQADCSENSFWCGRRDLNPGPQRGRLTS